MFSKPGNGFIGLLQVGSFAGDKAGPAMDLARRSPPRPVDTPRPYACGAIDIAAGRVDRQLRHVRTRLPSRRGRDDVPAPRRLETIAISCLLAVDQKTRLVSLGSEQQRNRNSDWARRNRRKSLISRVSVHRPIPTR